MGSERTFLTTPANFRDVSRGTPRPHTLKGEDLVRARLTPETSACLVGLAETERLSGRGTDRLLRVARTIGDLDAAETVSIAHLQEAAR